MSSTSNKKNSINNLPDNNEKTKLPLNNNSDSEGEIPNIVLESSESNRSSDKSSPPLSCGSDEEQGKSSNKQAEYSNSAPLALEGNGGGSSHSNSSKSNEVQSLKKQKKKIGNAKIDKKTKKKLAIKSKEAEGVCTLQFPKSHNPLRPQYPKATFLHKQILV